MPCARQGFQFLICIRWPLHGQKGHEIPFTTPTNLWSLPLAFCNVTLWKSYWKLDVWSLCCNMKMKDFIISHNLFSCSEKIDVGHSWNFRGFKGNDHCCVHFNYCHEDHVMLTLFLTPLVWSMLAILTIDSMLLYICSVIDHRWHQNEVKSNKWHRCFHHILPSSVIYYSWFLNRPRATWNVFVQWSGKNKDWYRYLLRTT